MSNEHEEVTLPPQSDAPAQEASDTLPDIQASAETSAETTETNTETNAETNAETTTTDTNTSSLSLTDLKPKMKLTGKVARVELYGAYVDLGFEADALLHISQLSTEPVKNVSDLVKVGDDVTVWVRKLDAATKRVDLTMIEPLGLSWNEIHEGGVVSGKVVRVEKFGAFIDIGAERPGMVHVSELASGYVNSPEDVVKVGDEVQAKVIKVNRKKQIDLSIKALEAPVVIEQTNDTGEEEEILSPMEAAFRRAMQNADMPLDMFKKPQNKGSKRVKKEEKRRAQQEEIYERTLRDRAR
jgi:small subunit ribosomal protein S1